MERDAPGPEQVVAWPGGRGSDCPQPRGEAVSLPDSVALAGPPSCQCFVRGAGRAAPWEPCVPRGRLVRVGTVTAVRVRVI